MSDIVELLRERAEEMEFQEDYAAMVEAANTIAQLRATNKGLRDALHMARYMDRD